MSIFLFLYFCIESSYATYVNTLGIAGNFTIEGDTQKVYTSSVNLNIDLTGVTQMRFGNTPLERDLASWEPYNSLKSWTIGNSEGVHTVYAEFQNNSSDTIQVSDQIVLRNTPSLPHTTGLTLWFDANDNDSISESTGNVSQWNDKSGNNYHAKQSSSTNQPSVVSHEIDFNGSSDYLYLENLHYTNANPLDGFLVCSVFRTENTDTGLSGNWAFLDFDRSEWFNFYNLGDGIGMSYYTGSIQDMSVSGVGINNNEPHVACGSYNNSLVNDTIITVDGSVELDEDRAANGSQIGVGQSTRYGFIGDGSEAKSENGSRNNSYYDGGLYEIVYFDSIKTAAERQDIECYLGEKWDIIVSSCSSDSIPPIASVSYTPALITSNNVEARLENFSEYITITNNGGSNTYTFTDNGSFTFEFEDAAGNTGSIIATVDWINDSALLPVPTENINQPPVIVSHDGASSVNIEVLDGETDITTVSAIDHAFNIIGVYGNTTLTGNTWLDVNHPALCNPAVVVSHRQNVNGEIQRAPRVRNKSSNTFQVRVENYNSSIGSISTQIDYLAVNVGSYNLMGGIVFEAGTKTTSSIACDANSSPTPDVVTFTTNFTTPPVVLHTVSTENDASWLVSAVNGNSGNRSSEPSITQMGTVLQRSFANCTHSPEDIDYFAIQPGNYMLSDGSRLDATRSSDSIDAVTTTGRPINFTSAFPSPPETVLVAQNGEDGGNGGYAQIHTGGGVTTTQVFATIDEDGPGADRSHTTEVVSSLALDRDTGQFWQSNTLVYAIVGGSDSSDFMINTITGKLDFISGKDARNHTDANGDGIYEVIVSVCDSHCNSACNTQTIFAEVALDLPNENSGFANDQTTMTDLVDFSGPGEMNTSNYSHNTIQNTVNFFDEAKDYLFYIIK